MKNKYFILLAGLLVLVSITSQISFVRADGGYFPGPDYWVRPGQQRAIILYEDNTETMILTSGFQGNAKDLVWIIPTPTKPELTKANEEVFTNMARLAMAKRDYGYGYASILAASKAGGDSGVVVVESKQVDYYDVNIIVATNSNELVKWFNDNDYQYPEKYAYVLNHYISKGWFFTAIKISPEAQGATEVIQDLREGNPTPVKLVFLSDKLVFPLKISSIDFKPEEKKYGPASQESIGATRKDEEGNVWVKGSDGLWTTNDSSYAGTSWSDMLIDQQPGGVSYMIPYRYGDYIPIQLYILADSKYESTNFYVQYGNWVKERQIEDLGEDDNGEPLLQPEKDKYFLTSLSANYQRSQMDDDLFLKKADDNKKVNAGPEAWQVFVYGLVIGFVVFITWVLSPLGIMFIVGSLILFLSLNKTARIFGWVIELFSLGLTLIIGILFLIITAMNGALGNYVVVSVLITAVLVLVIMNLVIFLQIRYKKDDN